MNHPPPILALHELRLGYRHQSDVQVVAEGLQEEVHPQEMIALIGPNGTGKSTLLRTIARMQKPLAGKIKLLGKNMDSFSSREIARYISVILTDRTDIGSIQANEVVAMGRFPYTGWLGFLSDQDHQKIKQAIAQTRIEPLLHKTLHQLSDGERQKVMIARALAQDTPLMLLDEPTTHLDISNRVTIMQLLRSLVQDAQKTIILSTHDLELALQMADRLWLMHDQTITSGTPEDLVLNGALAQVMGSKQAPFDLYSGTFRVQHPTKYAISLTGDGTKAYWTQRALERVGFQILTDAPTVVDTSNEGEWRLRFAERQYACHSIGELIQKLPKVIDTHASISKAP